MGQAQFLDIIRSVTVEKLCQPIFIPDYLGVLEKCEAGPNVQHGLRVAKWFDDPTFDDGVFPAIYAYTDGVPCRINLLSSQLRSYLNETHQICCTDVCEVAKGWLSEPGVPPAPSNALVGKRTPKTGQRLNVVDRTPPRRESPLNRLVTDFER
jgi:general secretion pathway protein A